MVKSVNILLLSTLLALHSYVKTQEQPKTQYGVHEIIGEQIVVIRNSGTNYISFVTIRTPFDNTAWSVDKGVKLDEFLDHFLYLNPIEFDWDDKSSPIYNFFTFSRGSYGTILSGSFKTGISFENNETFSIKDGVHHYRNEDGVKELNGYYGLSYEEYGFSQLTYAWILPEGWEFVEYNSQSEGKWHLRKNTLIFVGKNVNNLVFDIKYQRENSHTLIKIKKEIELGSDVEVKEVVNGLRIIFSEKIFFDPGQTSLSLTGKKALDKMANLMNENPQFNLQIHGHTDNVKFKSSQGKISNNWELSVFRSLSILNYLTKKKSLSGERFEVRGYGEYRPIAPNNTAQGRARNRRIELFLMDNQ